MLLCCYALIEEPPHEFRNFVKSIEMQLGIFDDAVALIGKPESAFLFARGGCLLVEVDAKQNGRANWLGFHGNEPHANVRPKLGIWASETLQAICGCCCHI